MCGFYELYVPSLVQRNSLGQCFLFEGNLAHYHPRNTQGCDQVMFLLVIYKLPT